LNVLVKICSVVASSSCVVVVVVALSSRCRVSTQSASWLRRHGGTHRHELIVWGGDGFAEVSRHRKNAGGRNHCFLYAKEIGANFSTFSVFTSFYVWEYFANVDLRFQPYIALMYSHNWKSRFFRCKQINRLPSGSQTKGELSKPHEMLYNLSKL
jgi:hypothetical protein